MPWSGVNRLLGFFSCNDSDVEECQSICFIPCADGFISPAKFSSNCFLLNLSLNCTDEPLVKEIGYEQLGTAQKYF